MRRLNLSLGLILANESCISRGIDRLLMRLILDISSMTKADNLAIFSWLIDFVVTIRIFSRFIFLKVHDSLKVLQECFRIALIKLSLFISLLLFEEGLHQFVHLTDKILNIWQLLNDLRSILVKSSINDDLKLLL